MISRLLAPLVYAAGILFAISAAAQLPAQGHRWPPSTPWFVAAALLSCFGLVWWRMGLKAAAESDMLEGQSMERMFQYLRDCRAEAERIGRELTGLGPDALRQRIDDLLSNHIAPFVENRLALVEHYGMKDGAEIMLQLALAERNFNRVWSAAADSCLPEAHASFAGAAAALEDLVATVERKR